MSRYVIIHPKRVELAYAMARMIRDAHPDLGRDLRSRRLSEGFSHGFAFEQAVLTLMQHNNVLYEPTIHGADNGDLVIQLDTGIKIIADCKLSCEPNADKLLVPREQASKAAYHIYIAGRMIDSHQMEVMGYTFPTELEEAPESWELPVPSLYCYYNDLYPIEDLLPLIARGRPREIYPDEIQKALQI